MSRIYLKVLIHNESDATLTYDHGEIETGSYTEGWAPPTVIKPGEIKGFQGEGNIGPFDVAVTGTEGRVWYNIVDRGIKQGQLFIHFDSPLIESQYGNTFNITAPPGWEVTDWGGQGHVAELHVRLRRTARRNVPNFNADGRGFVFTNKKGNPDNWNPDLPVVTIGSLWNRWVDSMPEPVKTVLKITKVDENWLPITHADAGMCGGMVFAVMDYYYNHVLPPQQSTKPSSRDDVLFQYLRDRLWRSFDVTGQGYRWLAYSSPYYPNGDEGVFQNILGLTKGRSWITYREEWPKIQSDIDAGKLSPIGLIRTDNLDIGANHQVLAYAYEKNGQDVRLYIYDPNHGQKEIVLKFNVESTTGEVHITEAFPGPIPDQERPTNDKRIFCFMRIDSYVTNVPPNGVRIQSLKSAIRASTTQQAPYSARGAIAGGHQGSLTNWMRSL
ncbi:hypothetical protein [Ectobacillus panaciterrae]|uniref:hypothetical protein n=1 Tax=Ectobacillus panaciterrae TaxID=363872 RepID=UPI00040B2CE7|nr:hypothetical protein [Ectobacillus panaciterrae]